MDDSLERPTSHVPKTSLEDKPAEDDEQTSEDEEDAGPDWTKLMCLSCLRIFSRDLSTCRPSASRPVIPKRGEKEFEPAPGGGSGLQMHVLDRARNAMSNALRATRSQSKCVSVTSRSPFVVMGIFGHIISQQEYQLHRMACRNSQSPCCFGARNSLYFHGSFCFSTYP